MILDDINQRLEEVDRRVYYGAVDKAAVRDTIWDYIVFNRINLKISTNKTSFSDYYVVHIVRENFIPDGIDIEVIEKMLTIDGMRLAGIDGEYNYIQKPNTNIVVEMLSLYFVRARK